MKCQFCLPRTVSLRLSLLAALLSGLSGTTWAAGARTLDCPNGDLQDKAVLKQAPSGAKRVGKHVLEVNWQGGKQVFRDTPPYDDELSNLHWEYCGYDAETGFHHLLKADKGLFTGVLLHEQGGKVQPAGQRVIFSPDRKQYFASRQPNGLDGEEWLLYRQDGQLLWTGMSGIEDPRAHNWLATLDNPRWSADNLLQADQQCIADQASGNNSAKTTRLTLTPVADDRNPDKVRYTWLLKTRCPAVK